MPVITVKRPFPYIHAIRAAAALQTPQVGKYQKRAPVPDDGDDGQGDANEDSDGDDDDRQSTSSSTGTQKTTTVFAIGPVTPTTASLVFSSPIIQPTVSSTALASTVSLNQVVSPLPSQLTPSPTTSAVPSSKSSSGTSSNDQSRDAEGHINSADHKVAGGALAGIIIVVLLVVTFLGVVLIRWRFRRNREKRRGFWTIRPFPIESGSLGGNAAAAPSVVQVSNTTATLSPNARGPVGNVSPYGANAQQNGATSSSLSLNIPSGRRVPVPPPLAYLSPILSARTPSFSAPYNHPFASSFSATTTPSRSSSMSASTIRTTTTNSGPNTPSIMRAGTVASANPTNLPSNAAMVLHKYVPTRPDEMTIRIGEIMLILAEYDDGWALCENEAGEQGMLPLGCLNIPATTTTTSSTPTTAAAYANDQLHDSRDSRAMSLSSVLRHQLIDGRDNSNRNSSFSGGQLTSSGGGESLFRLSRRASSLAASAMAVEDHRRSGGKVVGL